MYHLPNVKGFRTVSLDTKAAPHSPVSGSLSQQIQIDQLGRASVQPYLLSFYKAQCSMLVIISS